MSFHILHPIPILISISLIYLSSCTAQKEPAKQSDASIVSIIANAVVETTAINRSIAEMEMGSSVATANINESKNTQPVEASASLVLDWKGPVEPLLEQLSKRAGYKFLVSGKRPTNPVQTSVSGQFNSPLLAIQTVGDSVTKLAKVSQDDTLLIISVEYKL